MSSGERGGSSHEGIEDLRVIRKRTRGRESWWSSVDDVPAARVMSDDVEALAVMSNHGSSIEVAPY